MSRRQLIDPATLSALILAVVLSASALARQTTQGHKGLPASAQARGSACDAEGERLYREAMEAWFDLRGGDDHEKAWDLFEQAAKRGQLWPRRLRH